MRRVARQAALVCLHRRMFKHERPHGVGVALRADRELTRCGANLVTGLRAMRIVAVTALDQSYLHSVPVGPVEFCFLRSMTSEAELLLRFHQHEICVSRFVRAVAGGAAEAVCHVFRLGEILRLQAGLVAIRADGGRLRRT